MIVCNLQQKMQTKVAKFTTEVQGLNVEVEVLTKKLLNSYIVGKYIIEFLVKSFSPKPPLPKSYHPYVTLSPLCQFLVLVSSMAFDVLEFFYVYFCML